MNRREEILARVREIPALPVSVNRVIHLIQKDDSSIADIMTALQADAGLTTEVLKLANSAYFAGPRRIANLREAGVLLGTARVQQLVLAAAISPLATPPLRGYDLPAGRLLDHLLSVAIGAECLATALGITAPSHVFTAGLLHDIGKIVLGTFIEVDAEPIREIAFEARLSFEAAEREVLGVDHAEVGAALLDSWQLPEYFVQAVRYHHQPESLHDDDIAVALVHAADHLSIQCGLGVGIDGLNYAPSEAVTARLHLTEAVLEKTACAMLDEMERIKQTLR